MKKSILYIGFGLLIIFECLRVYLIMPMPGSQLQSIELAYFLGSNKLEKGVAIEGIAKSYPIQLVRNHHQVRNSI